MDGPIDAKGAFTSEIDLPPIIMPGPLKTVAEEDRPHLVDQRGMRGRSLIEPASTRLFGCRCRSGPAAHRRSGPTARRSRCPVSSTWMGHSQAA
jgi:hypothetical protein